MQEYVTVKILLNSQEIFMMNPMISIKKKVGDHTNVTVQGIVRAESYQILMGVSSMADLQIQTTDTVENLFFGAVTYLDIQVNTSEGKQYQELCLEALSYTCLLDQHKKNVSFQKPSTPYKDILGFVLKDYPGSNYILSREAAEKTIDRFVVQYRETDWDFLGRIASFLHLPLVASHITKGAKFTLGVIWKDSTYEIPPEDEWQVDVIHDALIKKDKNSETIQRGNQYIRWRVEDPECPCFEIGDCVLYQGILCYVKESEVLIKNHIVKQNCLLSSKNGFYVPETINSLLTGLSLPGSVKAVKNNQIMVKLDLDAWSDQECWFVYSTFYSTFYCMPEKGDRVNLYFPDHMEAHSFVLNSVRTSPQEAAARIGPSGDKKSSAEDGLEPGPEPNPMEDSGDTEAEVVDISPFMEMLADPENGKLINISAVYKDENSVANMGNQQGKNGNSSGQGQGNFSGGKSVPPQDYDFQSLAANEHIKVLSTLNGKMVILNDLTGSVSIVCNNGTYIELAGSEIIIGSSQKITFQSDKEIHLSAGKTMILSAEETIEINCNECGIMITPDLLGIQGADIKINE